MTGYRLGIIATHVAAHAVVDQTKACGNGLEALGGRLVQTYGLGILLIALAQDALAVTGLYDALPVHQLLFVLVQIAPEDLGMQTEPDSHLGDGTRVLTEALDGLFVFCRDGLHALACTPQIGLAVSIIGDAQTFKDEVAVPFVKVETEAFARDTRLLHYLLHRHRSVPVECQGLRIAFIGLLERLVDASVAREASRHFLGFGGLLALMPLRPEYPFVIESQMLAEATLGDVAKLGYLGDGHVGGAVELDSLGILLLAAEAHAALEVVVDTHPLAHSLAPLQYARVVQTHETRKSRTAHAELSGYLREVELDVIQRAARLDRLLVFDVGIEALLVRSDDFNLVLLLLRHVNMVTTQHQPTPITAEIAAQPLNGDVAETGYLLHGQIGVRIHLHRLLIFEMAGVTAQEDGPFLARQREISDRNISICPHSDYAVNIASSTLHTNGDNRDSNLPF